MTAQEKERTLQKITSTFLIGSMTSFRRSLLRVGKIIYNDPTFKYKRATLNYYAYPAHCKNRYNSFSIRKKSGGLRIIHAPQKSLKIFLTCLNELLQRVVEPHYAATGFVPGKSIVDNAQKHIGHHYVYNIDLKDFFHSFDRNRVKMAFMAPPFNFKGDKGSLAFMLASLCTHPFEIDGELKIVLPQGSPTSPTLTNILCKRLDRRLNGLAKRFNVTYTRYADDITFSSDYNFLKANKGNLAFADQKNEFLEEMKRIIDLEGLEINTKKTRLQNSLQRQEVTGLTVNKKVNVSRRYVKQLRMWLYYWEKYGFVKAEELFTKDYNIDKGHVKTGTPSMKNVIFGKLEYLKMVKGPDDGTYMKLKERFDKLHNGGGFLNSVLSLWEKEGIDVAIEKYISNIEMKIASNL